MRRAIAAALALVAMGVLGCGGGQRGPAGPPPPIDEDLVGLVPSGAEAVIDVDVEQLRGWPSTARLRAELPEGWKRLEGLGFDPVADLDRLAIGAQGLGTDGLEVTWIARGRLDAVRLSAALAQSDGAAEAGEYHGSPLVDGKARALALVTKRTAVFGSRADVRRTVDVAIGNDEGVRRGAADRAVVDAFGKAPGAKRGRPAVVAAARVSPELRAKLQEDGFAGDLVDWVAVALAVGDGIDIGVVAGAKDAPGAEELAKRIRRRLDELKGTSLLRLLGLVPFVDEVKMATRNEEVHLAFRLEQRRFDALADGIERLVRAARGGKQ